MENKAASSFVAS